LEEQIRAKESTRKNLEATE